MRAVQRSVAPAVGAPSSAGEAVVVRGLAKSFGDTEVLRGVDLTVPAGSLVALLGPSGCGKTTLLRSIAGLERPEAGEVRVGARVHSGPGTFTPPERRRIGMVFQDAALFPHLSVGRNVAYGLPRRDPGRAARVAEVLALVGLSGFADRAPSTLSGGQAQRVALARALAPGPSVILLDEPFSGLDAPLRAELRLEVRRVLAASGATAVFVTHDQEEAFVVGDEVAVMHDGDVAQQGVPAGLYELPATRAVAEFIGDANFLAGVAEGDEAETALGRIPLHAPARGAVEVMIRPERLIPRPGDGGTVEAVEYLGHDVVYRIRLDTGEVVRSRTIGAPDLAAGDRVGLEFVGAPTVAYFGHLSAPDADLIVLGAGPAGVGAAQRAARAGHRVTLLERSGVVGGAAGSRTVGGVRVDLGSHRLHPTIEPRILDELRRLLGDDLQQRPRHGRIRLAGRWIAFPLQPLDLIRRMPPAMALGVVRDTVLGPLRRPRADTFAEVLRAALGPAICERFYFPYARKIWGLAPEELSGEQARRRVGASSPGRIVRRILAPPDAARRGFLYPRRGYGQIVEALAEDAVRAGARVELRAEVTGVELEPGGARVHLAGGTVLPGRRVWSTIPLTTLAAIARPAPGPDALAAAGRLRFRAMLLVYLVLDRDRYTEFDAHYLPEAGTPVTRVSEPVNYRDGDDPPGRTVLCAEIPCDPGDALWSAGDDELGRIAADGLAACGLPRPTPSHVEVERLRHAYPVLRAGSADHLALLDAWAQAQPSLLTLGRQGLFVHDNAHHALAMAWAAVDCLGADGSWDAASWAAARRRFAEHVVED